MAGLRTMIVIGLTAAAGFAAGWIAKPGAAATPLPPSAPCAEAGDEPSGAAGSLPLMVERPAGQVSDAMPGDILAGVDDGNPAAVDMAFVRALIPLHEQKVMAARQMLEHGEDDELKGVAETVVRTRQGEIVWLRGWLDNHEGPENRTP